MKLGIKFRHIALMITVIAALTGVGACDALDPEAAMVTDPSQATDKKDNNEVCFTFDLPAGKALVRLSVENDTVWISDVQELNTLVEQPTGAKEGQAASQEFSSALQSINIDWSYEGGETDPKGRSDAMSGFSLEPARVKDISIRKLPLDSLSLRPVHAFQVEVNFEQKALTSNMSNEQVNKIEYTASYIAIVGQEPTSNLKYEWQPKTGTKSTASPFVKDRGRTMELWLAQTSTYTSKLGRKYTARPTAKIKLAADHDTVWAKSVDELRTLANISESEPSVQSAVQKFGSDLQGIDIEWSYQRSEATVLGKKTPMPYYSLAPAALKDVTVKELTDTVIGEKMADIYEVTATFSQKAVAENVMDSIPDIEIEYEVSYIGAIEIYLVDVEYIPSGEWIDPHDNLALGYYAKVDRYRTYSNGKRIGPDEFYDYGHLSKPAVGYGYVEGYHKGYSEWVNGYPYTYTAIGDSIAIVTQKIEYSKLGTFEYELNEDGWFNDNVFPNYPEYWESKLYGPEVDVAKNFANSKYPADDRPSGWYFYEYQHGKNYWIHWITPTEGDFPTGTLTIDFTFNDQFLVIDGRRIDFSPLHNLKLDYDLSETDFEEADKKGKIAKLELNASFLGKNFYAAQIDTLYVKK